MKKFFEEFKAFALKMCIRDRVKTAPYKAPVIVIL